APMAFPRAYHNLTILADGTVLATGGERTGQGNDVEQAVYEAELWNPATETWSTMARLQRPRLYHSGALLLPDGRVLMAGGNLGTYFEPDAEIYSPPYLFKGPRPAITTAPTTVAYGGGFFVETPDTANITGIALVRTGAPTHGFDQNQRYLSLSFATAPNGLDVTAPADTRVAPPGDYLLFILNAKGGVLGHRIEILSEDDESRPAPAARKAEKLILQDGVKLLIGAVSSSATMAVMDVTRKYKTIQWNSVACAEFMRTTKFHKYYFSNQPDARMQARGVATYILEKVGTKAYVLYTDYAMGQVGVSDGRQFKMAFEKAGGQVVGAAGVPADARDFSPWFDAIDRSGADVLFLAFSGTDSLRPDDSAPRVRDDEEVQARRHRLLPAPAGSPRRGRADGRFHPDHSLLPP